MTRTLPTPPATDDLPAPLRARRVAIVHEWLITLGGSDRVVLALHQLFPNAPIFVALHDPSRLPPAFHALDVRTSWLQRLPGAAAHHRLVVPLMPFAFGSFDLRGYDLVLSSSHACAKGVRVRPGAIHVCYCHTPMRYAWDLMDEYLATLPRAARPAAWVALRALRRWDIRSAARVHRFVANSQFVAGRIRRSYGRDAVVIYPPVDVGYFTPAEDPPPGAGDYFLAVGRLVRYKRMDLAVEAFNRLGAPLIVAGDGPEAGRLRAMAARNVRFVGEVSEEDLRGYYRGCRALVFPGVEDFGLVPVEAQACGRPVVAYGAGGAVESVVNGVTGILFEAQTASALARAVERLESATFDPARIRAHALGFSTDRFRGELLALLGAAVREREGRLRR